MPVGTCGVGQHEALALVAGGEQHARLPDRHADAHSVYLHSSAGGLVQMVLIDIKWSPRLTQSHRHVRARKGE